MLDECARVLWLDSAGDPTDPFGEVPPSYLQIDALVGHFSSYSVVAVAVPEPSALLCLLALIAAPLHRPQRRR